MNYSIYITHNFEKEIKKLGKKHRSVKADLKEFVDYLKENPTQGTPLGKNCYKIRLSITSKGKGKSSGSRVITCVKIVANSVYLLSVYDKSEKENISDKELDDLLKLAGLL